MEHKMSKLFDFKTLLDALKPGNATTLTSVTELEPAAGPHVAIAPARYTSTRTKDPVYAYEDRFVNGERVTTVLIDSKSSQANRVEEALAMAINDGHPILSKMPRVEVSYEMDGQTKVFSDLDLPHRLFDAHIRAGLVGEVPVTEYPEYVAARNSSPSDAWDIFHLSPTTVLFGGWDSHRRSRQGRYPSVLVGEIIGVLADQDSETPREARHSGARIDPVAMGLNMSVAQMVDIVERQQGELGKNVTDKLAKKTLKASELGFGAIPPSTGVISGIATKRIIRSHVLSFPLLRRLRFGKGVVGDTAIRALLAAVLLNGLARSDSELHLRANTHLTEAAFPEVGLTLRGGERLAFDALTIEATDTLLQEAYAHAAREAGVEWAGQVLHVTGDQAVVTSASDTEEG